MKILILPSWYPSDKKPLSGIFIKDQFELLNSSGIDAKVIAVNIIPVGRKKSVINYFRNSKNRLRFYEDKPGVFKLDFLNTFHHKKKRDVNFEQISNAIHTYLQQINWKPNLIHVHDLDDAGSVAIELNKKYSYNYVLTQHNSILSSVHALNSNYSKYSDIFIKSSGNAFVSRIENLLWIRAGLVKDVNTIGNFINEEVFYPSNKNISCSKLNLVSVTATSWIKNNSLLLKSVSLLLGKIDFTFNMVIADYYQDRETIENLKELISEYNLTEHVKIHLNIANRKQMANIYRKSDVFISTSNYETFGVALAESISCGCFGISLMNGGSLEIINDGVNGFLLSEIEILNLEQVIKKIDFSQSLRITCHNSIKNEFGRMAYLKSLKNLYVI